MVTSKWFSWFRHLTKNSYEPIRLRRREKPRLERLEDRILLATDFGDAPDPLLGTPGNYPTLAANGGAQHTTEVGFLLGNFLDDDLDGQLHPQAQGDDLDGNQDDDGVSFINAPFVAGGSGTFDVTVTDSGGDAKFLDAWIDLNQPERGKNNANYNTS